MSNITFMVAKIGGGKSRKAAEIICQELAQSDRMVVTNLATWTYEAPDAKHLSLADWCFKYVGHAVDVGRRVRVLSKEETGQFYRHYPGFDLPMVGDNVEEMMRRGVVPLADQRRMIPLLEGRAKLQREGFCPFGCLFVIDEVHLHFPAREWQRVGCGVEHYMSQLRKLNDDCVLITQDADKVDKNFRRNATEWIYFRNMSRIRLWGGVSLKNQFRFAVYETEPQRGDDPMRRGVYRLEDKEYEKVYDTMAGVGLSGRLFPEKAVAAGGHWIRWVGWLGLLVLLAVVVPPILMRGAGKMVNRGMVAFGGEAFRYGQKALPGGGRMSSGGGVAGAPVVEGRAVSAGSAQSVPGVMRLNERAVVVVPVWERTNVVVSSNVWWNGYGVTGGQMRVFLSDGDSYVQGDGHLQFVTVGWVQVDGVKYRWRKEAWGPAPAPVAPGEEKGDRVVNVGGRRGVSQPYSGYLR